MPSGGHARSGPAPDPAALRRGAAGATGWFPLSIPTDPPPPWPLLDDPSLRELSIWNDLWSRPAATAWPAFSLTREVAVYARCLAEFESPGKTNAALGNLVRSLADDLGLTIPGARRNEWLLPNPPAKPAAVTPIRPVGGRPTRVGGTPALDLLARWLEQGVTFPADTVQYADAVAELSALGIDADPYDYHDQQAGA